MVPEDQLPTEDPSQADDNDIFGVMGEARENLDPYEQSVDADVLYEPPRKVPKPQFVHLELPITPLSNTLPMRYYNILCQVSAD